MPWYCCGCGRRRGGSVCAAACRDAYGDAGAERVPPLDGVVFFDDNGSGIPRWEQRRYDEAACRRGAAPPRSVQGPRPSGWSEALEAIKSRATKSMTRALPEC